jgi:hypothetical protein
VSPASFIDAEESIIEVSGSEGKSSTAGQGNNNEGVDMDNGGEKEDRGDVDDGNKSKDKVCPLVSPSCTFRSLY